MKGIRARLLLLVALAIGPLFLFTLYQGIEERRRAGDRERADARRLAMVFAAQHGRLLADARQLLFVLAQGPTIQQADAPACARLFSDILTASPQYENLVLTDAVGTVVASAHPVVLRDEDRALLSAAASDFAVGPFTRTSRSSRPTLSAAQPVPGDGPKGRKLLLFTTLNMDWVAKAAEVAGLGPGTRVTLWDASGRSLLRHPDPEGFAGRDASNTEVWRAVLATQGEGTAEAEGGDGVRRLYGFTRLPGRGHAGDVVLSLGVPSDVAFADLRRLERRNLLGLGVVTLLIAGVTWFGADRLVQLFGRMQRMAERDALTGLPNRRRLMAAAREEVGRARRFEHPLATIMIDVDRFKLVNDRHGHGAGDDVLSEVARRLQATVRATDIPARYGGEEFSVLLPETDLETARAAAERVRLVIAGSLVMTRRGEVAVTVSAGVAVLDETMTDLQKLFDAADAALYVAKSEGRNRVVCAPTPARPR